VQKHPHALEVLLQERDGKVDFLFSEDLSGFLEGSRSEVVAEPVAPAATRAKAAYHVHQKKGPLLPIKRYNQLEDRVNKTHIVPLEILLPFLAKTPGAFMRLHLTPISERHRHHAIKKAKREWFEPERHFDQWESKKWFSWGWRRMWGPLLRMSLPKPTVHKASAEEQTESLHEKEDPRRAVLDKLSRPLFHVRIELSHPFHAFFHALTLPYLGELSV